MHFLEAMFHLAVGEFQLLVDLDRVVGLKIVEQGAGVVDEDEVVMADGNLLGDVFPAFLHIDVELRRRQLIEDMDHDAVDGIARLSTSFFGAG